VASLFRKEYCKPQIAVSLAPSRASRLWVHPFDPLSAPCGSHEWIRKVLCFPHNLVASKLHDAYGVGWLPSSDQTHETATELEALVFLLPNEKSRQLAQKVKES
jgi:hypothetical protein